jgi:ribosomal protein S18 acetylase RimI-like enzyme
LIAYLEGYPVGMASGVPALDDPEGVELISLWVSLEACGRGVRDRLLDDVEHWAVGFVLRTMRLSVMPSNKAAIGLYYRHDLGETGEKGDLTTDGASHELVMAKSIGAGL